MAETRDRMFGIIYVVLGLIMLVIGVLLAVYRISFVGFLLVVFGTIGLYVGSSRMRRS